MEIIKFTKIKPASYNPRLLTEEAFQNLKGSISELGFILPIIVNKDSYTIVAGHQRTKVASSIGMTEAPCYFISGVDLKDEVLFNQIHNGVEYEPTVLPSCKAIHEEGFVEEVPITEFTTYDHNSVVVNEMCRMIIKYGDALCAIICDGKVVFGGNYIYSCKRLGKAVNCSFISKDKLERFNHYFSMKYGVFNYDKLERKDFVQGLAQPNRYKGIEWSPLYSRALPSILALPKDAHILDFGCGKGMFIGRLRRNHGYKNAIGLEFFNHNRVGISIQKGHEMINQFIESVKKNGLFDVVICDAVVNSVNTQEAEDAVLGCINAFLKPNGKVFLSGRRRESIDAKIHSRKAGGLERLIYFVDDCGLTGILREGQWYFQKFIDQKGVDKIIVENKFLPFLRYTNAGYFGFGANKIGEHTDEVKRKSIDYEFNLSLPNNQSYNRQEEVKELLNLVVK